MALEGPGFFVPLEKLGWGPAGLRVQPLTSQGRGLSGACAVPGCPWAEPLSCEDGCSGTSPVSEAVAVALFPAVERRRRDKINNWIVQLSKIIPDCNADNSKTGAVSIPDPEWLRWAWPPTLACRKSNCHGARESSPGWRPVGGARPKAPGPLAPQSKGGILSKACDYIRELRQTNQRMQETFKEAERLQMDNELLRQQVGAGPGAGQGPGAPDARRWPSAPLSSVVSARSRS